MREKERWWLMGCDRSVDGKERAMAAAVVVRISENKEHEKAANTAWVRIIC